MTLPTRATIAIEATRNSRLWLVLVLMSATSCTTTPPPELRLPYIASLHGNPGAIGGVGMGGTLEERNGCVVLPSSEGTLLPLFLPGYHLSQEADGRIAIRDAEGKDVGSLGQDFGSALGGGVPTHDPTQMQQALQRLQVRVPASCDFDEVSFGFEIYRPPLWQDISFPTERVAETDLVHKALTLAHQRGVEDPPQAQAAMTTRRQVPGMLGDSNGGPDDQILVVQVWGPFPCDRCDRPDRVVWLTGDVTSGEVIATGAGRSTELWRIGVPVSVLPGLAASPAGVP